MKYGILDIAVPVFLGVGLIGAVVVGILFLIIMKKKRDEEAQSGANEEDPFE